MLVGAGMKMYVADADLECWLSRVKTWADEITGVDAFFLPPFVYLAKVAKQLRGSRLGYGAQNMHWEDRGAYTGEVSPVMLKDFGVQYVELGHAERRRDFNETNATVNLKVRAALRHALSPIICVGEETPDAAIADDVLRCQVEESLADVAPTELSNVVIAYEPVWAIGVGRAAAPEYVFERHTTIRATLVERYGYAAGTKPRVIYGGSVTTDNARDLVSHEEVQGLFVGRAALDPERFRKIVACAAEAARSRS
jgi:triosephosphate isomerase (TIM)